MSYALLIVTILCGPISILLLAVRCGKYPWQDINGDCEVLVSGSKPRLILYSNSIQL